MKDNTNKVKTTLGIFMLVFLSWTGLQIVDSYTGPTVAENLSQRSHYRVVTDGERYDFEKLYLSSYIPFQDKWSEHTGEYAYETVEEATTGIDFHLATWTENMEADNRVKTVVKTD